MNAAQRFVVASRAHDVAAAVAELAPDVEMFDPVSDHPKAGRQAVAAALAAVEGATDEFRHTHILADTTDDSASLFGLVFEARVGEKWLHGIDLVEIDSELDHIVSFTVLARPVSALMALGARMAANT